MENFTQIPPLGLFSKPRSAESPQLSPLVSKETDRPVFWRRRTERIVREQLRERSICILENQETGRFSAAFGFELAGVVLNGCNRVGLPMPAGHANKGDHLLSRMLATLDQEAALEFVFGGGGNHNFSWHINGRIYNAASKSTAVSKARMLRQNLELVLASEPAYRFAPKVCKGETVDRQKLSHCVRLQSQPVCLEVERASSPGFSNVVMEAAADNFRISLAHPLESSRSFGSLIEVVTLSPAPLELYIRFRRFDITPTRKQQIADVLKWFRRNHSEVEKQLAGQQLEGAASVTGELIRLWLNSTQGIQLECQVISEDEVPAAFLAMIGRDVFGGPATIVKASSSGSKSKLTGDTKPETRQNGLQLENCLPLGLSTPSVFPSVDSLHGARIRRFYNLVSPIFPPVGIVLGAITEGRVHPVRIDQVARSQHMYLLGATGTGKSTLLANMIIQDIRAGHGVAVIDPHGDLIDRIVPILPPKRLKDVVLFNAGNPDFVPGLNILECPGPNRHLQINFAINELLKTFERIYDMRQVAGPMFETYFRNALLLLLENDLRLVTLLELSLVFESRDFRRLLLARCRNPSVVRFWKETAEKATGDSALTSMGPYITSKLNAFIYNGFIRPIVGQAESTIDFRQIMDARGILLIKLPKGLLGELDAQLLGSFILSRIFSAAMGRANVAEYQRPAFHLYVDEFQNFVHDGVAFMLAESRKYGLHLTLANQNLCQLSANLGIQNLLDAVLGNVGSLITFRLGPPESALYSSGISNIPDP